MNIKQTCVLTFTLLLSAISCLGQGGQHSLRINSMEVFTLPGGERFIPVNRQWNNNWHYIDESGNYFFLEGKVVMSKYKGKRPRIIDFVHFSGKTFAVGRVIVKSVEYFLLQEFNQISRSLDGKIKKIITNSLSTKNAHLLNSIKFINTPGNEGIGVIYQHTNEDMAELGKLKYRFIGSDLKPIFRRTIKFPKEYQQVKEGLFWGLEYEYDPNVVKISDNGTLYITCKWLNKGVESFQIHQFHKDKTKDKWWKVNLNSTDGYFPATCSVSPVDTNTFEVGLLINQGQKKRRKLNSKMGVKRLKLDAEEVSFSSDEMTPVKINAQIGFEEYRLDLVLRNELTYVLLLKLGYSSGHDGSRITTDMAGTGLYVFGFDTLGHMQWECDLTANSQLNGRLVNARSKYSSINEDAHGYIFPGTIMVSKSALKVVRVDSKADNNKYCYVVQTIDTEGEEQVELLKNTSPYASRIIISPGNLIDQAYVPILRLKSGRVYGLDIVRP